MDKMREALRRWHYEKSEAHDQLDFPKPALNLSSAEGFEAGYTIATAESQQTIERLNDEHREDLQKAKYERDLIIFAQQQQIAVYREARKHHNLKDALRALLIKQPNMPKKGE